MDELFGHKTMNEWEHIGICTDGQPFQVDGIDIWKHEWKRTGERAEVKDPQYGQGFSFAVWSVNAEDKRIEFAAGEFSNCVWGFYRRNN